MDQCTHEVRAEYWKKIIRACGQRPAGQSAKSWMDENGIREQSYYHWQRRFREQAYEEMKENASVPAVAEKAELTFVEVPCHTSKQYKKMWNEISQMFLIGSLSGIAVLGDVIRGYLPVNLILLFVFVNMGIALLRVYRALLTCN